jgi:high-affinity Fe2+/Pb2+ permease
VTAQQIHVLNCLCLLILAAVAVLTRATRRRIGGAVAGAAAAGVVALGIIAFGQRAGWWHFAIPWEPYFLALFAQVKS